MKTGTALLDFKVHKELGKVRVKREFNAPVSKVWAAFTESDLLDQWWAPKPWKARTKTMDFREGGYWLYAMVGPDNSEQWCRADFLTIDPQKLFTAMDAFCDINGKVDMTFPRPVWNVKFNSVGNSTIVDVECNFEKPEDLQKYIEMGFQEGFTAALENLDELLS
jgi:PhnB protein